MNAKLAKAERRNLRKEMGETATDALERARAEVLQLRMEHAAIAKTLADFRREQAVAVARVNLRVDGASTWCEQNEARIIDAVKMIHRGERLTDVFILEVQAFLRAGFLARLRWLLFGTMPDPYPTEQAVTE